ncbi:DUF2798 domain-containing protein [Enterococcus rivorum]|uniref:DUF2798 domain-containing protein n=2 Tax=Enterococcus rivorum TaxID=762845 RepID=A0A1E5KT47_9ENTE|nr:hypothetical protein BCR26_05840 [Enterococcus rivorum]
MNIAKKRTLLSKSLNLLVTTALISFTLTLVNSGTNNFSYFIWLRSWLVAFVVILFLSSILPQRITTLVTRFIDR